MLISNSEFWFDYSNYYSDKRQLNLFYFYSSLNVSHRTVSYYFIDVLVMFRFALMFKDY